MPPSNPKPPTVTIVGESWIATHAITKGTEADSINAIRNVRAGSAGNILLPYIDVVIAQMVPHMDKVSEPWSFELFNSEKSRNASVAEPLKSRYAKYSDIFDDLGHDELKQRLEDAEARIIRDDLDGSRCETWTVHSKRDKYSYKKLATNNFRIIQGGSLLLHYLCHKYLRFANKALARRPNVFTSCSPAELSKRLMRNVAFRSSCGIDFSGFDASQSSELTEHILRGLLAHSDAPHSIVEYIVSAITQAPSVFPSGLLLMRMGGNPSGCYLTTTINTILHLAFIAAFNDAFDTDIDPNCCGDDGAHAGTDEDLQSFVEHVVAFGELFGFTIKVAESSEGSAIHKFPELPTFLGRRIVCVNHTTSFSVLVEVPKIATRALCSDTDVSANGDDVRRGVYVALGGWVILRQYGHNIPDYISDVLCAIENTTTGLPSPSECMLLESDPISRCYVDDDDDECANLPSGVPWVAHCSCQSVVEGVAGANFKQFANNPMANKPTPAKPKTRTNQGKKQLVAQALLKEARRQKTARDAIKVNTKQRGPRSTSLATDSPANSYANALMMPFSRLAIGARVPDQWAYPTVTYKSQGLVTIKSDAFGVASFYATYNPFCTIIDAAANSAGVTSVSIVPGATNSMRRATSSNTCYAAADWSTIEKTFSSFRVVGGGFNLRSVLPALTTSGKVVVAAVPGVGYYAGPKYLDNNSSVDGPIQPHQMMSFVTGLAPQALATHIPTSILALPTATYATTAELEVSVLSFTARPVTPQAYAYKATDFSQVVGQLFSLTTNDAPITVGEVGFSAGNVSYREREPSGTTDTFGFEVFLVSMEGLPPGTNCFDLEYILHYEGMPPASSSSGSLVADGSNKSHVDINALHTITNATNNKPPFRLQTAVDVGRKAVSIVGKTLQVVSAGAGAYSAAGGGPAGGIAAGLAGLNAIAGMI